MKPKPAKKSKPKKVSSKLLAVGETRAPSPSTVELPGGDPIEAHAAAVRRDEEKTFDDDEEIEIPGDPDADFEDGDDEGYF